MIGWGAVTLGGGSLGGEYVTVGGGTLISRFPSMVNGVKNGFTPS